MPIYYIQNWFYTKRSKINVGFLLRTSKYKCWEYLRIIDAFNAGIIITCSSLMPRIPTRCCKISSIMAFVQWAIEILRVLASIREPKNLICCVPFKYNKQMNYQCNIEDTSFWNPTRCIWQVEPCVFLSCNAFHTYVKCCCLSSEFAMSDCRIFLLGY